MKGERGKIPMNSPMERIIAANAEEVEMERLVAEALANPCSEEHSIEQECVTSDTLRMWFMCGGTTITGRTFDISGSMDITPDLQQWAYKAKEDHRLVKAPAAIVDTLKAYVLEVGGSIGSCNSVDPVVDDFFHPTDEEWGVVKAAVMERWRRIGDGEETGPIDHAGYPVDLDQ